MGYLYLKQVAELGGELHRLQQQKDDIIYRYYGSYLNLVEYQRRGHELFKKTVRTTAEQTDLEYILALEKGFHPEYNPVVERFSVVLRELEAKLQEE